MQSKDLNQWKFVTQNQANYIITPYGIENLGHSPIFYEVFHKK